MQVLFSKFQELRQLRKYKKTLRDDIVHFTYCYIKSEGLYFGDD